MALQIGSMHTVTLIKFLLSQKVLLFMKFLLRHKAHCSLVVQSHYTVM